MLFELLSTVESRLYSESMTGATAKSKPKTSKLDEKELSRLQKQDYWLQVSRAKLAMDLIFVCTLLSLPTLHNTHVRLQPTIYSG